MNVIPNLETKRFIIKVPKIDEKYLEDTSHVVDYQGRPTGIDKGIIFHNGRDKTDQLVKGDGTGILIINNVTEEQSIILNKMKGLLSLLPGQFYVKYFKEFINECNNMDLIDPIYSFHEELKSEFLYGKKEETERTNVENVVNTDVTIEEDTPYNFETRKFSYDDSEDGFSDF